MTGDKSLRFEERILQKQQEESPMTGYNIASWSYIIWVWYNGYESYGMIIYLNDKDGQ